MRKPNTPTERAIVVVMILSVVVGIYFGSICLPYILDFNNTIVDIPAICIPK